MDQKKGYLLLGAAYGIAIAIIIDQLRQYYDPENRPKRWTYTKWAKGIMVNEIDKTSAPPMGTGIESTIGSTPLIRIPSLSALTGCNILAKCEHLNGAGFSPKDRVALSIITRAEDDGLLTPHSGDTIYEGTVGSTGISLATLCRAKGYQAHICMPNDQSHEKSNLLLKLGAVVERVPPAPIVDQAHFVNRARNLAKQHTEDPSKPGRGYFANQFETEANWRAHYEGTGPEIYEQCNGTIDAFCAGAGTGGTISGVAMYLKEQNPDVKIILADPQGSGLYNKIKHGVLFHSLEREGTRRRDQVDTMVEGIGLTRSTLNFEQGRELIDDAVKVRDQQAMNMARWLVERDGIFVGSSSAVNCVAALQKALELGQGHTIVTILCDSGNRHLSKFWARIGDVGGEARTTLEDILQGRKLD
ncbi:Cysteine synthase 2 [Cladophialophora chaetospira]|uniref:Cysteine synthase 2 n=1 Tax=Cladophialophora chaetospira TaxID=386627 RepID=A0AA39CJ03_9EURO|nr:Cysteine synthase 2 [Cladophialophora chaetospira]